MTKEIRSIEFIVLPTSRVKARKMFQIAGACRFVWNHFRNKNLSDNQKFKNGEVLGIDMNVRQVATSEGYFYFLPDLKKKEARRKKYQKRMARQIKGSNRRKKTRKRLAKVSRKISDIRKDWIHQTTREIADKCGTIVIEGLNVKGMTASAKRTVESPGKNVKQKAGLNNGMLDTAFGKLKKKLEYKCGRLIEISPAYTSQTCSECGHTNKENRKTQSRFQCVCCDFESNADTNAAINIRRLGMAQLHGEGSGIRTVPTNREIDMRLPDGQQSI